MRPPRQHDASNPPPLALEQVPGRFAVCRLSPDEPVPAWALNARGLVSITRSDRELSIVAEEALVPPGTKAERGFVALRIAGTLDFNFVGVIARLTGALADAGVPVFVISSFETDYLLVKAEHQDRAIEALVRAAGIIM